MFKLVVALACVMVVTVAEPGYIGDAYALGHGYGSGSYGYGHGYGNGYGHGYEHGYAAIPSAVSHQSRVDIYSKPIIKTVVATAPVVYTKPHYVAATSHQSRVEYISKPIVYAKPIVSYAAPHLSYGSSYVASTPIASGLYGSGYQGLGGYGLGYGQSYGYGHGLSYGHGYAHDYYGSHY